MGFRLISWLISILIVAKTTLCATPGALTENFCHEHEINRYVTHRFNLRLVVEEKNCASTGEMILAVYDAPESHISKAYFPAELKALKWIRGKCYIAIQGSNGPSFVERAVACAANLKLECVCRLLP